MPLECPECGYENPEDNNFCVECGYDLRNTEREEERKALSGKIDRDEHDGLEVVDLDEKGEIEKIKDVLQGGEKVLMVANQKRFRPGGSLVTPNTIFATDRKIVIRNPTALGLRSNVEEIPYDKITGVKLEKGMFTHTIVLRIPGVSEMQRLSKSLLRWGRKEEGVLDALPKNKAEKLVKIIREKIYQTEVTVKASKEEDPLTILKTRFAKGEISQEEFMEKKKLLEE